MQITIEDNSLIYIYLKEQHKYIDNIAGESNVQCFLQYDEDQNWIGVRIPTKNGSNNKTLMVGNVDYPIYQGLVTESEDDIFLIFDRESRTKIEKEQDCNIDVHPEGIYGIEMILWNENHIESKEKVRPFIKRDI
jgi:hypothetical protein